MTSYLHSDLREQIAQGNVLCVVGSGVTIASTAGSKHSSAAASWSGLLDHGIIRGVEISRITPEQAARLREMLQSGDLTDRLTVAHQIETRLGAPTDGEYSRWLRESLGMLQITCPDVLEALRDMDVPLATTNCDGFLEEVTGLPGITWQDTARVERVLQGKEKAIIHLHGYYQRPETVVLGILSYMKVLNDAHSQTFLRAIRSMRTLLFVGCGEGLIDPNFGAFFKWSRGVFAGSETRHFILATEEHVNTLSAQHPKEERIFVMPYGKQYTDLAPYLRSLYSTDSLLLNNSKNKIAYDPDLQVKSQTTNGSVFYGLRLKAEFDEFSVADADKILAQLRALAGDFELTLEKIKRGSVILVLRGSSEGYRRLQALLQDGQLSGLLGSSVLDIKLEPSESELPGESAKLSIREEVADKKQIDPSPQRIFCSYAPQDVALLHELENHLAPLKHQGRIESWHDRRIIPGAARNEQIEQKLAEADIILLLISADFMASDNCMTEANRALERQRQGQARVIPILLRPVSWQEASFSDLQCLPSDRTPVSSWRDHDAAWIDVVRAIGRVVSNRSVGNWRLRTPSRR